MIGPTTVTIDRGDFAAGIAPKLCVGKRFETVDRRSLRSNDLVTSWPIQSMKSGWKNMRMRFKASR